jgi:adenylyltransferase/sulfurtransferase
MTQLNYQIYTAKCYTGSIRLENPRSNQRAKPCLGYLGISLTEFARNVTNKFFRINPSIQITTRCIPLSSHTLSDVFIPGSNYDAVLDCTDTPSTRYLLSDVTARIGIPLISGAAQRTDGQLVVYNVPPPSSRSSVNLDLDTPPATPSTGPCMRCVFPSVSRTGAGAERCSDVGVLGPVVGVIGVLMALETIKILTGFGRDGKHILLFPYVVFSAPELRFLVQRVL